MGKASRRKRNGDERSLFASKLTPEERINVVAIHEAGHVVSAIALGWDVEFATVFARETGRSHVIGGQTAILYPAHLHGGAALTPEMLRKRTIQSMAGAIAENLVFPTRDTETDHGAINDAESVNVQAAFAILAGSGEPKDRELLDRVRQGESQEAVGVPLGLLNEFIEACEQETTTLIEARIRALHAVAAYLRDHVNEMVQGEILKGLVAESERSRRRLFSVHE